MESKCSFAEVTESQKRNLAELFEFWRFLSDNPSLKIKYFALAKRLERDEFINDLGFDSNAIRTALGEIKVELNGRQLGLLDWLDLKGYGTTSDLPIGIVLSALRKQSASASLDALKQGFVVHLDALQGKAGGARPQSLSSRQNKSTLSSENIDNEIAGLSQHSDVLDANSESEHPELSELSSFEEKSYSDADLFASGDRGAEREEFQSGLESLAGNDGFLESASRDAQHADQLKEYATELQSLVSSFDAKSDQGLLSDVSISKTADGVDVQLTGSVDVKGPDYDEQNARGSIDLESEIDVTGQINVDVDLRDRSIESISGSVDDIDIEIDSKSSEKIEEIDETNAYGDVKGELTETGTTDIGINIDPSDLKDSSIDVQKSDVDLGFSGTVDEQAPGREFKGPGGVEIKESASMKGDINANLDINLKDPSESSLSFAGTNLELKDDTSATISKDVEVDGVDIDTTLTANLDTTVDLSPGSSSISFAGSGIDGTIDASLAERKEVASFDTPEGIESIYVKPSAEIDFTLSKGDSSIDLKDASLGLTSEFKES